MGILLPWGAGWVPSLEEARAWYLLKQVQLGLSRIEKKKKKEKSHAVPPHRTVMQPGVRGEQGLGLPNRWATGKALHEAGFFF